MSPTYMLASDLCHCAAIGVAQVRTQYIYLHMLASELCHRCRRKRSDRDGKLS